MCRYDEGFSLLFINQAVEGLTGYPREEFLEGRLRFNEIQHPDDVPAMGSLIEQALDAEEPFNVVYRLRHKDGYWRWIEEIGIGVFENGVPIYLTGFLSDITRRRLTELEREALITELRQSNADLQRFAHNVSHRLKTPLVTIKGFISLLAQDHEARDEERFQEDLRRMAEATDAMQQLFDALQRMSRIARMAGVKEEVEMGELITEALVELEEKRGTHSNARIDVASDLPVMFGNRARLLEMVVEILDNALKFTIPDEEPSVEVGWRYEGVEPVLTIRDYGIGVRRKDRERIFGLFEQLKAGTPGIGLGLALVRQIVELHNGMVWVEQPPGDGLCICFMLPPKRAAENVLSLTDDARPGPGGWDLKKKKLKKPG